MGVYGRGATVLLLPDPCFLLRVGVVDKVVVPEG